MTVGQALLPPQFADLEPFAREWALEYEEERYAKRLASPMDEIQALYDAVFPRAEEAIAYCDQFPLDEMPDDARHLMWLLCALITVSYSVDCFKQPKLPDSGASYLLVTEEPTL